MRTLIIVKPDWVNKKELLSELFALLESHGLNVIFSRKVLLSKVVWREFYADHLSRDYFERLIQWMSSSTCWVIVVDGYDAVDIVRREIVGRNGNGIRGKYQIDELRNVAHTSDSVESAKREIDLIYRFLPN